MPSLMDWRCSALVTLGLFPPPLHLSSFISLPPLCVFFLMYPSVSSTRGAWVLIEALNDPTILP